MKLLMKREEELRCTTLHEISRNPLEDLSPEHLRDRIVYLEAQIRHSFHITAQLHNALSEQFLIIQQQDSEIKELNDDISYFQKYTRNQLDLFRDDIISSFESPKEFRPVSK